jgi:hypothetical protein
VADHLGDAVAIRGGDVSVRRDRFFVPLENNLFKAAAAAGLFGDRETYLNGVPAGRAGNQLQTETDVISIGPDLQLMTNPGEAFPALMLGSPWGVEDAACPERPNPPVPAWHLSATHRFQVGLANDMIGYEIPAWGYSSSPGAFSYNGPPDNGGVASCANDGDDVDRAGHQHKLETEGAGPTASNMVAEHLAALADRDPDALAKIRRGRYLYADGSTSRRPQRALGDSGTEDAVGVWLADPDADGLVAGTGTIIAIGGIAAFGDQRVDGTGRFMDYDGQPQSGPGISTRGMRAPTVASDDATGRYYLNVYPALGGGKLGSARDFCKDSRPPRSRIGSRWTRVAGGRLRIRGTAADAGCAEPGTVSRPGRVADVRVSVARRVGRSDCRFLRPNGRLAGHPRPCAEPIELTASGQERWKVAVELRHLPKGRYLIRARASDGSGNRQRLPTGRRGPNAASIRLRHGY